jgi:hypothetical protein
LALEFIPQNPIRQQPELRRLAEALTEGHWRTL